MKITKAFVFLSLFCFAGTLNSVAKVLDIYVGNIPEDEIDHIDEAKTFAHLQQAIDYAYKNSDTDITINLFDGEHRITAPIIIDSRLNGLSIKGSSSANVTLKGSSPLELKWKKYKGEIFVASLDPSVSFDQLIVNGKKQTLARYPNYNEDGGYWQGYAADAIAPERIKNWKQPEGAIFNAMHGGRWGGFHYHITGIDEDGEAILEGGVQNNRPSSPHKEYRMVENVMEELDAPGEWYVDKTKHKLYYYPSPDLKLKKARCEGVILKSLIELKGSESKPVRNITIQGIKLTHTQRTIFEEYTPLLRSDWSIYRGAALFIEGAEYCSINNCEFSDLGGNAIFVSGYNTNINISRNHIHDCGASAICFVGEASAVRSPAFQYGKYVPLSEMDTVWGPKTNDYPHNCTANDNLIHRIGRYEKQTAGVQIAMAMNITVSNNSIYDVPRAGINVGDGTWGGHIIEYNDVFNTVLETSDHGAFNSWGRDRFWHPKREVMNQMTTDNPNMPYWDAVNTTVIRYNRFRCDHGWDIDLDDGSTNYHIYSNVCLNGGIKLREGFARVVENNVMINNTVHTHVWFEKSEDVIHRNILFASYKDVGCAGWGRSIDYNLFPNQVSLLKAQVYDIDEHSAYGEPQFIDAENLDYRVADESPALALGFMNFPMTEFGVKAPELKALAKTPEIPHIKAATELEKAGSQSIEWLRADIKSVDSPEEQSAYGLNTTDGVIVKKIGAHSIVGASGLKRGDVILNVEGEKIIDVIHLLNFLKENNTLADLDLIIMRNQAEMPLTIKIK